MADDGSDAATIGGATTAPQSTEPMVTRSGANASRPMVLSSNTEFSESNDDDLHNSDDDFNASKQSDEDAKNDWMH